MVVVVGLWRCQRFRVRNWRVGRMGQTFEVCERFDHVRKPPRYPPFRTLTLNNA